MEQTEYLNLIEKDIKELYIGNLNTIEFNLDLPHKGKYGSTITWESANERIITKEGIVNRPVYGQGHRTVALYATFSYGEAELTKEYKVRVLEEKNKIQVKKVYPIHIRVEKNNTFFMPSVAIIETVTGQVIPHEVIWKKECYLFNQCQETTIEGVISGTDIPVLANISVKENVEEVMMDTTPHVSNFASNEVLLKGESAFKQAEQLNLEFLLQVDDNQMLYNFRQAAGLDTKGAKEMIGWDAPTCLLRGHTTGHYLSALALCYAVTGNEQIYKKAGYMIEALRECQIHFEEIPAIHKGFLSGYSEEQFDLLEEYTLYPKIWAPYYTLHKIFAGLLDCKTYLNSEMALQIADELGDWVYNRLSKLSHQQLSKMWSLYIAGEFGGMNEVMARLYEYTHKKTHLEAAYLFDNDKLFYPMSQQVHALDTLHANQHIPQVIGAMQIFEETGEQKYYDIAAFFWESVTANHSYSIGGVGEGEMFHEPGRIAGILSKHTAESCASYNMLKLTKKLFRYNPEVKYMDYYERTMINHILASSEKKAVGRTTYFMPLGPGHHKEFDEENSCCHGTGLENHFRYTESIYFKDYSTIYINLFVPSEVYWKEKNVKLILSAQENHPEDIWVQVEGAGDFTLKIRKPYWCEGSVGIRINDKLYPVVMEKGYIIIQRKWETGDKIHLNYPCSLRIEQTPDDPNIISLLYGPYVLAAITEETTYLKLNLGDRKVGEVLIRDNEEVMFKSIESDVRFMPLYKVQDEYYQVYIEK